MDVRHVPSQGYGGRVFEEKDVTDAAAAASKVVMGVKRLRARAAA